MFDATNIVTIIIAAQLAHSMQSSSDFDINMQPVIGIVSQP